jgi:hypothetical protein
LGEGAARKSNKWNDEAYLNPASRNPHDFIEDL